jgi:hypothetical protein
VPSAITPKKRQPLEPITYDELLGNAGMSGFVSFLEAPSAAPAAVAVRVLAPEPVVKISKGRIRRALAMEDGHSLAEQAVYTALWKAATPVNDHVNADRTIRVGYHKLAQMTRLSWVSVKSNLRSLEKKLALEVISAENSATQEGKRYLVYAPGSVLERRKKAGLEWVRRTRGVELLGRAHG